MKNFKKILCLITAVVLVFSLAACGEKTKDETVPNNNPAVGKETVVTQQSQPTNPDVLAKFDGKEIKKSDLESTINLLSYVYSLEGEVPEDAVMQSYALQYYITSEIYNKKLTEYELTVSDEDIQKQLETIASEYENGIADLEASAKEAGVTMDDLKNIVRSDLAYAAVEDHLTKDINITDDDCKKYFDENPDEFVTTPTRDFHQITYDSKEEAEAAIAAIKSGTEFSFLANSRNEAIGSDENGNMATVANGELSATFNDIAFSLSSGQVYETPIESEKGFHVIMVDNFVEAKTLQYDEVLEELRTFLRAQEAEKILSEMFDTAYQELGIEIYQN